jgi:hypothetical protein
MSCTCKQTTLHRLDAPIVALPCSHVYASFPSTLPIRIVPVETPMRFPKCTTWLSTYTLDPSGAGLRYVQFSVRETWPVSQNPSRLGAAMVVDVQMSKMYLEVSKPGSDRCYFKWDYLSKLLRRREDFL